jgi:HD-like signal output (HDOD) protein/signal transduction histidine kinase
MGSEGRAAERLPSLPQILVRILDAVHSERTGLGEIADLLRQDPGLAVRLIQIANSSFYARSTQCHSVERALIVLGTETIRTVVITDAIRQFYSRFEPAQQPFLKAFWRRSLTAANFAHILANLTSYASPEEAYLCGLLIDAGQLILFSRHGQRYLDLKKAAADNQALLAAEQAAFGTTHAEIGADMVQGWQGCAFMADALRYQHEPGRQVQDAHHLVKIINLASQLSAPDAPGDDALQRADLLFGLNEALTRELCQRVTADVKRFADSFGIDIGGAESDDVERARTLLGERLGALGQVSAASAELWHSQSRAAMERAVQRTVHMTLQSEPCFLFLLDPLRSLLEARLPGRADDNGGADFALPLLARRSCVSDALLEGEPRYADADGVIPLAVIDRQLLGHCRARRLLCLPLRVDDEPVGVLVLGIRADADDPLQSRPALLGALCREIAASVQAKQRSSASVANDASQLQHHIREVLHEAGNPLSIIRNYLETLTVKLGEEHQAHGDLALIKGEIDRVGTILLRLRDPQLASASDQIDVGALTAAVARIFQQSLCVTHQVTLTLQPAATPIRARGNPAHLQQVLTNLLKNAVEALPEGGQIELSLPAPMLANGQKHAVIVIEDNGPGIPETVMQQLFSPVASTKGGDHGGLGLSISRKLIEQMGGTIWCRSDSRGTQFQILLPQ